MLSKLSMRPTKQDCFLFEEDANLGYRWRFSPMIGIISLLYEILLGPKERPSNVRR